MGGSMTGFVRVSGMNQDDIKKAVSNAIKNMGPEYRSVSVFANSDSEVSKTAYYPAQDQYTTTPVYVSYCYFAVNDGDTNPPSQSSGTISAKTTSGSYVKLSDNSFTHIAESKGDGTNGRNLGRWYGVIYLPAGYNIKLSVSAIRGAGGVTVPAAQAFIYVDVLPEDYEYTGTNNFSNDDSESNYSDFIDSPISETAPLYGLANSQAQAETIANALGLTLVSFSQGVADYYVAYTDVSELQAIISRGQSMGYQLAIQHTESGNGDV